MTTTTAVAVDIRPIVASQEIERAAPLLRAHWLEIAKHRDVMVLDPDPDGYRALEASDSLISLGAFDGEHLVGYSVSVFQRRHLHYRGLAVVMNDVIFVDRAHRNRGVGSALIVETERQARERGARVAFWHAKSGTALDDMLFGGLHGYGVQDVIYARKLEA